MRGLFSSWRYIVTSGKDIGVIQMILEKKAERGVIREIDNDCGGRLNDAWHRSDLSD